MRLLPLLLLLVAFGASARDAEENQDSSSAYSEPTGKSATDEASCAAKWERYRRSQECFARYRNANSSLKPGAFEHCKEENYPAECPL